MISATNAGSLHHASYPFPISLLLAISISPSTLGIFLTLFKKPLFYSYNYY